MSQCLSVQLQGSLCLLVDWCHEHYVGFLSLSQKLVKLVSEKALGATRGNILLEFSIEVMVLTTLGEAIGLAIAQLLCLFSTLQR